MLCRSDATYMLCRSEGGQGGERSRGAQQRQGDPEHASTNGASQRYVSSIPGLTHRQEQVRTDPQAPSSLVSLTISGATALW